ncbi:MULTISPECIES: TrmB family transcriptional regulator [Clostridium]|uniref:TrmB family transcriptional regulator n=1 Tax=Clostridium cibarium TaxID=2762247 RepID=A0ABR8PS44_9CLOT|nr:MULTISPECIES: TrmB family transcriptional regulator [Clostridium]MBD7910995.1 TrmB family transcriptional regulator [Clostridium cibarium]
MEIDNLVTNLEKIGFSKLESQIYLALLEGGNRSAYQIAKKINISRPSIYNALEHMVMKGMVEVIPNSTALYIAEKPEVLIKKVQYEFDSNAKKVSEGLNEFKETRYEEHFANISGFEAILYKAKDIIANAQREVYLNSDFDLEYLTEDIRKLTDRGIRVVTFSFYDIGMTIKKVEFYSHMRKMREGHVPSRLMVVVDQTIVLVADASKNQEKWIGTVTNNPLMIKIMSEHIHNDIYLLKLREKYGKEIDDLFHIGTDYETRESEAEI